MKPPPTMAVRRRGTVAPAARLSPPSVSFCAIRRPLERRRLRVPVLGEAGATATVLSTSTG